MNLQKILRPIVFVLLFCIPIFPLIVANDFFFPFITGKAFYFRILVELAFAGWIILAFLDAKYRPRFTPLFVTVSLFALVTLLADIFGVNPLRSIWSNFERMEGWLVIIHLWAFFVTMTSFFGHDKEGHAWWHRWIGISLLVASIVGIYGFVQLFGGAAIHQGSTRIDASLGNAAYMAVYMLIHAFAAAYMFLVTRAKSKSSNTAPIHWIYGAISIIFAFLVFETSTRGTILGLIGGTILALGLYALLAKKESIKSRWISVVIIAVIFAIGGIFWANRNSNFVQKHEVLQRLASISVSDVKTQARGYIWPMAIKGFEQRPILGWGQENFNYIFNANYNPKMWSQEQWFDRAHNVYLDWLTASGLVGVIIYLALYVFALMGIWKSRLTLAEKSALTGLVAAYAVHNVFVFDNLASYAFFFAFLGFTSSLHEGKHIKWMGKNAMRHDAVEYIAAPIVIVLLVASLYFLNVRPIQANTGLIEALKTCASPQPDASKFNVILGLDQYMANQEIREQLLNCATTVLTGNQYQNTVKQSFASLSTEQIEKQIAVTPNDARAYALAGSFYNSIGQYSLATPTLEKAVALSPNKQSIALVLAGVYANNKQVDQSLAILEKLYELTPEHPGVREIYAKVLIVAGKDAEAQEIFGNDPDLLDSESVAMLYASLKEYDKSIVLLKKLVAADPKNADMRGKLIQVYVAAGRKWEAITALQSVAKDFPEFKTQVEDMIKELQK